MRVWSTKSAIRFEPELRSARKEVLKETSADENDCYKLTNCSKALYIRLKGRIISALIWEVYQDVAFIGWAWTAKRYRGKGLYRRLFEVLVQKVRQSGIRWVACGVGVTNGVSQKVHSQLGLAFSSRYCAVPGALYMEMAL